MQDFSKIRLKKAAACLNFSLRRTSRLVNQYYDRALKPVGIGAGQFNLMVPLAGRGFYYITELAEFLGMERSALARTLKPLEQNGWVTVSVGTDRRTRIARLTHKGERLLLKAYPLWERAQAGLTAALTRPDYQSLLKGLGTISNAAGGDR